jgi:hypothetical protein
LLGATVFVGAVVLIGMRATNTKGEPPGGTVTEVTGTTISDALALDDEEAALPG